MKDYYIFKEQAGHSSILQHQMDTIIQTYSIDENIYKVTKEPGNGHIAKSREILIYHSMKDRYKIIF